MSILEYGSSSAQSVSSCGAVVSEADGTVSGSPDDRRRVAKRGECIRQHNKLVLILAHEYTHAGWMVTARTLRT